MKIIKRMLPIFCLLFTACNTGSKHIEEASEETSEQRIDTPKIILPTVEASRTSLYLDSLGLIDIQHADSSIAVKLIYATPNNFTKELLYEDLKKAYLHPDALKSLVRAQQLLKEKHPGYSLIVYDAARPMSVQKKMWDAVKGTSKRTYVSNPANGGGLHNYGLAVDLSIIDENGEPLPMGTEVDHLGIEAHITNETELIKNGKLSEEEQKNRQLLRQIMREAGFQTLNSEWWHFNLCSREEAKQRYKRIE
ncbi:M15 family metallopeptidase [Bacteroides sp.]